MDEGVGLRWNERRAGDRRRRRFSLVLHERRSGFDRRGPVRAGSATAVLENTLVGLRFRPGTLWAMLAMVNALNLADFALTLKVLAAGGGEVNPIMRSLFALNPAYAGVFKVMAVLLTTLLVWRCRRFRRALEAALVMMAVFAVVFFYHIYGLVAFG
jgi:hypothetical protein